MKKDLILLILLIVICGSCAQYVAPTGGQPDKEPPTLIKSLPENRTRNFTGKEIVLTFDELIDASSMQSELLVVPTLEKGFETKVKNNQVTIKFSESLDTNTTYTFNFRNSVKDLTEKNPSKNLKIVLSTGNDIDSLKINGEVKNLFTGLPQNNVTIGLYPFDTLAMEKRKPLYFVKTDSTGKYEIENLKSGKYFLLALDDKNNNLRFDQKEEYVGFVSDSLIVNENITLPEILIYPANRIQNKVKRTISRENEFVLNLEKTPKEVTVLYNNQQLSHQIGDNKLTFFNTKGTKIDTVYSTVILKDSLLKSDTLEQKIYFTPVKNKKKKVEILALKSNIGNNAEIANPIEYILHFQKPITKFRENKIVLKADTSKTDQFSVSKVDDFTYAIKPTLKVVKDLELIIPSNTFENYLGDTNAILTLKNKVLNVEQLGIIEGSVGDNETPKIAQLLSEDRKNIIQEITFKDNFLFENIIPGNYNVKVIWDDNENGIWDPGNLKDLSQPEKIVTNKDVIRVRANFEIRNLKLE